jgi:hypothetical protein
MKTRTAVAFLVLIAGCSNSNTAFQSSDNLKQLSRALIAYNAANNAWPVTLEQVKPLIGQKTELGVIGDGKDYAALTANPLTGDKPGYEYVKPADASIVIFLYQLRNGKRDTSLPVAFSDGSVREAK